MEALSSHNLVLQNFVNSSSNNDCHSGTHVRNFLFVNIKHIIPFSLLFDSPACKIILIIILEPNSRKLFFFKTAYNPQGSFTTWNNPLQIQQEIPCNPQIHLMHYYEKICLRYKLLISSIFFISV